MDYEALFDAGTYALASGISVFAGTTDDAFWIDLGAAFDTANFRTLGSGVPGVLTAAEDAASQNFASDTVSGYAVNTIAIEVPIALLTRTGRSSRRRSPAATIGVWGTTSRPRDRRVRRSPMPGVELGRCRQVQRMGNPLINELHHRHRLEGPLQHGPAAERQPVRALLPRPADRAHRQGALRRRARRSRPRRAPTCCRS